MTALGLRVMTDIHALDKSKRNLYQYERQKLIKANVTNWPQITTL